MLLVIHNLPSNTRYADVKALIKEKCGLTEMIVDNLVAEGVNKKVTVGLADEGDAALLSRKINGLYLCDQQLYVEDVRQMKNNEQPYRPTISNQYNQTPQTPFQTQFFGQSSAMPFQPQPLMSMETQLPNQLTPNFGVPFYMTAQKQNLGNNPQFMVQYPKVQGSMGNETSQARDFGFAEQYGRGKLDQSMSFDRSQQRESSPRRPSRWNEPDCDRSDGRRSRDRPSQRNSDRDSNQSYKDNSYQDSFQSRSNQDYGSNKRSNNKFEKPSNRSESNWDRPNSSTFGGHHEQFGFNDNINQDRHYDQERESQRHRENSYSQSRDYGNTSRSNEFSKKRPYDSSDKNQYGPQSKKFGGNQQYNTKTQQGASSSPFSINYQAKKNPYSYKAPVRATMQQNRPQVQPKGSYIQSDRPQMQPKGPHFQINRFPMHPKGLQKNKPPGQQKNMPMKNSKKPVNVSKARPEFQNPVDEGSHKYEAWRVQAAAVIATQIFNNVGRVCYKRDPVLVKLKTFVRARIDVIAGNDMTMNLKDMLSNYRDKFQDDDEFYNAVVLKVENSEEDKFETPKKVTETEKKIDIKPTPQFSGNTPPSGQNPDITQRLPKYPAGDKKRLSQMKKAQKLEMMDDSLYNLDPEHEKALNEELDKLDNLVQQELNNPQNDIEWFVSEFMKNDFVPDLRKVLALHVKKRILDVRTNLSVRVICPYKAPNRAKLDAFLKNFGVLSLKASEKNRNVLIAICDSYENFDALCMRESEVIGDLKISFKPLHITGPPVKNRMKGKPKTTATKPTEFEDKSGIYDTAVPIEIKSDNDEVAVPNENKSDNDEVAVPNENKSDNDEVAVPNDNKSDNDKVAVPNENKSDNDEVAVSNENKSGDDDAGISGGNDEHKNGADVQMSQANEDSDSVILVSDKSEVVTVIEDNVVKSNEDVDKVVTVDDEGSVDKKHSGTVADAVVAVQSNDSGTIAADDLEDF